MGDPIKKVDLDDILRKKVEESQFSFSEEHWNKLNVELTKQREKKSASKGIVSVLKNRWIQSALVAAVAVFATYLFMINVESDATKQTPSAQNTPAVQSPSNNNIKAPLASENNDANNEDVLNTNENTSKIDKGSNDTDFNTPKNNVKLPVAVNTEEKQEQNNKYSKQNRNSKTFSEEIINRKKQLLALEEIELKTVDRVAEQQEIPATHVNTDKLDEFYASLIPDTTNNSGKQNKMFALEGIGMKAGMSIAPSYNGAPQSLMSGSTFGFFSSFNLTPKFSLQAEVLFTQVKGHKIVRTETRGETVYTDIGTGRYNYTESLVEINGLNYFRFPVIVKYKLAGNLSIGAGGYYSRFESPTGTETQLVYDDVPAKTANNNYVTSYVNGAPLLGPQDDADATRSYSSGGIATQNSGLRNYDMGVVFDVEYRLKRWSLGARFNQGITDITPDDVYNVNKVYKTNTNAEITVGFLF